MSFLMIADTHLTAKPADEYRWGIFDWIKRQVEIRGVDDFFILGDLTDQKDNHPSALVNRVVRELTALSKVVKSVVIIKGNHDYVDPALPFFSFLSCLDGIKFFVDPVVIKRCDKQFLILPHTRNYEAEWGKGDEAIDFEDHDYILLHQCIGGAMTPQGHELDGVPKVLFGQDRTRARVLAGDIHMPQTVGNVEYIGAPYPITFGDTYQPRALFIDDEGNEKWLKIPSIKKIKVKTSDPEVLSGLDCDEGDHLRVVITLNRSDFVDWEKHRKRVFEIAAELKVHLSGVELCEKESKSRKNEVQVTVAGRRPVQVYDDFCETRSDIDEYFAGIGRSFIPQS